MRRLSVPTLALAMLAVFSLGAAPASATSAASTIDIVLDSSPSCVKPGKTVNFTVGVKNTTAKIQRFWVVFDATYNLLPLPLHIKLFDVPLVSGEPTGPLVLPPNFGLNDTLQVKLPNDTLPGRYSFKLSAGPSEADAKSFDSDSADFSVNLVCLPGAA